MTIQCLKLATKYLAFSLTKNYPWKCIVDDKFQNTIKLLKNLDTRKIAVIILKVEQDGFALQ